jgi:hypothetical protein
MSPALSVTAPLKGQAPSQAVQKRNTHRRREASMDVEFMDVGFIGLGNMGAAENAGLEG